MATVQYSIITTEESMKPGTIQVQNKSNRYLIYKQTYPSNRPPFSTPKNSTIGLGNIPSLYDISIF